MLRTHSRYHAGGGEVHALEDLLLDLPAVVAAFSQRLHEAGMPVSPARAEQYARSLGLTQPVARRELYWTTRSVFVTGVQQVPTFDRVFHAVFGNTATDAVDDPELAGVETRRLAASGATT